MLPIVNQNMYFYGAPAILYNYLYMTPSPPIHPHAVLKHFLHFIAQFLRFHDLHAAAVEKELLAQVQSVRDGEPGLVVPGVEAGENVAKSRRPQGALSICCAMCRFALFLIY